MDGITWLNSSLNLYKQPIISKILILSYVSIFLKQKIEDMILNR